jgi:hypothetical protein
VRQGRELARFKLASSASSDDDRRKSVARIALHNPPKLLGCQRAVESPPRVFLSALDERQPRGHPEQTAAVGLVFGTIGA